MLMIEAGYCQCGCGQKTTTATASNKNRNMIRGQPMVYIKGHNPRGKNPRNRHITDAWCPNCKQQKPANAFRFNEKAGTYESWCKRCADAARVGSRYGLTANEYLIFVENKACEICGKSFDPKNTRRELAPQIDHCHETGKVRGVLCGDCNNMLGRARDRIDVLENAISYLRKHQEEPDQT